MTKKSYSIMNISYRDKDRTEDYLLDRVDGKDNFYIPINMNETQYMYPSEYVELICLDTLKEQNQYTKDEVVEMIKLMEADVLNHINDIVDIQTKGTSDAPTEPINDERMFVNILSFL